MRKYAGASLVVLGIVLTAYGLDGSGSMNSRISRLFTVWPPDGPACLLIGGFLSVLIGLALISLRRQRV